MRLVIILILRDLVLNGQKTREAEPAVHSLQEVTVVCKKCAHIHLNRQNKQAVSSSGKLNTQAHNCALPRYSAFAAGKKLRQSIPDALLVQSIDA